MARRDGGRAARRGRRGRSWTDAGLVWLAGAPNAARPRAAATYYRAAEVPRGRSLDAIRTAIDRIYGTRAGIRK